MRTAKEAVAPYDGSDGQTIRRVSVMATVWFDAYVVVEDRVNEDRIERELKDAIEFHAPHLSDTEDDDALVAMCQEHGTSDGLVSVTVTSVYIHEPRPDLDEVVDAIERTEAWL